MALRYTERAMPSEREPPPVLGSWRRIYLIVLGLLALWILLFAAFTAHYRSFS